MGFLFHVVMNISINSDNFNLNGESDRKISGRTFRKDSDNQSDSKMITGLYTKKAFSFQIRIIAKFRFQTNTRKLRIHTDLACWYSRQ